MSYLYINSEKFNINNLQIKIINDNLILNYHLNELDVRLKNIILHINGIITKDGIKNVNSFKFNLNDKYLLKNLDLIDNEIVKYINRHTEYEYIPIIKEDIQQNKFINKFINIYLYNINLNKLYYNIDAYIMIKFKLINNKFIPKIYTYNVKLY